MTLLAKPSEITKGQGATFTLNKAELALLPQISGDSYFSDVSNWKEVFLNYISPYGARAQVRFDAVYLMPQSDFFVTEKARGEFDLESIIIYDFDNGYLKILGQDLVTSDFELSFAPQTLPPLEVWYSMGRIFSLSEDFSGS